MTPLNHHHRTIAASLSLAKKREFLWEAHPNSIAALNFISRMEKSEPTQKWLIQRATALSTLGMKLGLSYRTAKMWARFDFITKAKVVFFACLIVGADIRFPHVQDTSTTTPHGTRQGLGVAHLCFCEPWSTRPGFFVFQSVGQRLIAWLGTRIMRVRVAPD